MASESYQNKNEAIGKGKIGGLENELIKNGINPNMLKEMKELFKNGNATYEKIAGIMYKYSKNTSKYEE